MNKVTNLGVVQYLSVAATLLSVATRALFNFLKKKDFIVVQSLGTYVLG